MGDGYSWRKPGRILKPGLAFATTRWSLVLSAGAGRPESRQALEELCQLYWAPVRGYIRHRVRDDALADDLTQGFFTAFLERGAVSSADADRGRFRSFLLTSVKYYLADERDKAAALKRGSGVAPVSLDAQDEEGRTIDVEDPGLTPEREYDRQWALAFLARARARLDEQMGAERDADRMRRLAFLATDDAAGYAAVARELGMNESAVKVAVHRLRRRFAVILRDEVARIADTPEAIEDELRFLLAALTA